MLLGFGIYSFRSNPTKNMHRSSKTKGTLMHNFITAFLVTLSNPLIILLFMAVFAQLAVNGRRARIHDTEMAEAVVKGQTVNVQDRMNKMKRLQKRVNRQKNHGIFRYLGALAAGAATYFIMEFASSLNNVSIYHFGAVALTVLLGIIMFMGDDGG